MMDRVCLKEQENINVFNKYDECVYVYMCACVCNIDNTAIRSNHLGRMTERAEDWGRGVKASLANWQLYTSLQCAD